VLAAAAAHAASPQLTLRAVRDARGSKGGEVWRPQRSQPLQGT
jgi:hypothetical protein